MILNFTAKVLNTRWVTRNNQVSLFIILWKHFLKTKITLFQFFINFQDHRYLFKQHVFIITQKFTTDDDDLAFFPCMNRSNYIKTSINLHLKLHQTSSNSVKLYLKLHLLFLKWSLSKKTNNYHFFRTILLYSGSRKLRNEGKQLELANERTKVGARGTSRLSLKGL